MILEKEFRPKHPRSSRSSISKLLLQVACLSILLSCSKAAALPGFSFSEESFADFVHQYLPKTLQAKVLSRAPLFLQLLVQLIEQERSKPMLSRLVDKQHPLSENYVPEDLVALKQYSGLCLAGSGFKLRNLVIPDLLAMNQAALAEDVRLSIGSTYRSFAYQQGLFKWYSEQDGAEAANRESARAGQSQHQLGLVIDFSPISQAFAQTAAGNWTKVHALEYGFSLSYPEGREERTGYIYEPWHFRYVGSIIAQLLREYFDESQQDFLLFWNDAAAVVNEYYLPKTPVKGDSKNSP